MNYRNLDRLVEDLGNLMSEDHLRIICRQMLEGVRWLHESGVIHGDIQPENFFVDVDRFRDPMVSVRIGDFETIEQIGNGQSTSRGGTLAY